MPVTAPADSARVSRELELARQRLLDLTMRNKLLNHKPAKISSIRIVDEIPREVYDILVLQERNMEFETAEEPANAQIVVDANDETIIEELSDMSEEEATVLWQPPSRTRPSKIAILTASCRPTCN